MSDLEQLCHTARRVVTDTAVFIRGELGKVQEKAIEEKGLNSLVSYVDRQAEKRLVAGLAPLRPGSVFLTEEDTVENQEGEWQWIIDPLDGTTNFLFQLPVFSVSVGLRRRGETVLGIVYEVNREECFYAWEGSGAFLNDRPIRVRDNGSLAKGLLATGFPYRDFEFSNQYFNVLLEFTRDSRGVRRLGSAAVDLAYVAAGRFDGFYEYGLKAWDVAGGAFLVKEAGGIVTDFAGENDYLFGGEIIAATPGVHKAMLASIGKAFGKF